MNRIFVLLIIFNALFLNCLSQNQSDDATFNSYSEMVEAAKKEIVEISSEDFQKQYSEALQTGTPDFILIDIRTEAEFDDGSIPGAFLIQRGTLESKIEKETYWENLDLPVPQKTETIILYCRSGSRSALATQTLQWLGYSNVKSLSGGWSEWSEKYPNLKR